MNELTIGALLPTHLKIKKHQLPPLKYDYAALEPYIDTRTMVLHHDNHHACYVRNLNDALEHFPELRECSALWLLLNLDKVPEEIREVIHQSAGGHVNHSMFWRTMKPKSISEPKGALRDAINRDFGSFHQFKAKFEEAGVKLFGSGWVWLTRAPKSSGKLEVITTNGHDHPMMQSRFPLLLNDVWEHAYYLNNENRRAGYLKMWWSIVDWDQVSRCFECTNLSFDEILEVESQYLSLK